MTLQGWVKDLEKETVYCTKHYLVCFTLQNEGIKWRNHLSNFGMWLCWWLKSRNFLFIGMTIEPGSVCGGDCRCDRLRGRWCIAVREGLSDTCSDWVCLSTGCPWPVESEAGGRRVRERQGSESLWAGGRRSLSGLRGRVNALPITPSSVSSISGIQTQLCTSKQAKADICMPTQALRNKEHTHTLWGLRLDLMWSYIFLMIRLLTLYCLSSHS